MTTPTTEESKERVFTGWLDVNTYGVTVIKSTKDEYFGEPIAELLEDFQGKEVSVHYYITNKKMSQDEALESSIRKDLGGVVDAEYDLDAYSSWTVMELDEKGMVGGHDLIDELGSHEGKYCILVVQVKEVQNEQ